MKIDTSSTKEQRNFGLVMAGACLLLGLYRFWKHGHAPLGLLGAAVVLAVLGLAAPAALRPLLVAWLKLAEVLNWVVTHVVLTISFFVLIVPTRVLIRLFADDPLKRRWDSEAATYWETPDAQPAELEAYKKQF